MGLTHLLWPALGGAPRNLSGGDVFRAKLELRHGAMGPAMEVSVAGTPNRWFIREKSCSKWMI